MEAREQRGLEIAATTNLTKKGPLWLVPSSTGSGTYVVDPTVYGPATCTCPDFELRGGPCKHVYAVEFTIRREITAKDGSVIAETITYRQEWTSYNLAQTTEKLRVAGLLRELCSAIDNPIQKTGRPRLPLSDMVFAATMKVYGGMSARRTMCDLQDFAAKGLIDKVPHFNSVLNVLENPGITAILKRTIEESATPLAALETDFAADSSGFSTNVYARWFSAKYGREMSKNMWLKAHCMIGTHTNIVTAIEVTDSNVHDTLVLPDLLNTTDKHFTMKRVSADKGYLSDTNVMAIATVGAEPFIPPKVNSRFEQLPDASRRKSDVWRRMFHFYQFNREEFLKHYHRRSNVETVFHMVKAKFGSRLLSKTPIAQTNEVLCKILCHNLCVLVQSAYELGVQATFWKETA